MTDCLTVTIDCSVRPKINLQRLVFPTLIGLFVLSASAYSMIVPLGEAPDEVSHWAYVQSLLTQPRLPAPEGAVLGEAHQPPLYYLIGSLATFWIPRQDFQVIANPDFVLDDPQTPNLLLHTRREAFPYHDAVLAWHLVRLLSVAMGVVTVWVTWRLASEIFPSDLWIALGAAALIAFLPEFLFISAAVNNDNLNSFTRNTLKNTSRLCADYPSCSPAAGTVLPSVAPGRCEEQSTAQDPTA